jgi:hypothetical protein
MTRSEANLALALICFLCLRGEDSPIASVVIGMLTLWFMARALFPKLDRYLLEDSNG